MGKKTITRVMRNGQGKHVKKHLKMEFARLAANGKLHRAIKAVLFAEKKGTHASESYTSQKAERSGLKTDYAEVVANR